MSKRLYVGNLPYVVTREELSAAFEQWGPVETVTIITDHETGESKGFAFIQLADEKANEAIDKMNGTPFKGRPLRVKEARPREQKPFESSRGTRPESSGPWESREPGAAPPSMERSDAGRNAGRSFESRPGRDSSRSVDSRPGRDSGGRDSGGRDSGGRDSGGRDSGGRDSGGRGSREYSREFSRDSGSREGGGHRKGRDGARDGGRGRDRDRDRWNRDWE